MIETMQETVLKEKIKAFVMPRVQVGDPVLWHSDGKHGNGTRVGFVKSVGSRNISIIIPMRGQTKEVDGVAHKDDPGVNPAQAADVGLWSKTPFAERMDALEEKMEALGG